MLTVVAVILLILNIVSVVYNFRRKRWPVVILNVITSFVLVSSLIFYLTWNG